MNWFLVQTTEDGREMWQYGNGYPRAYVWEYNNPRKFYWALYGVGGNDEVGNGSEVSLSSAMNAADKAMDEYNG